MSFIDKEERAYVRVLLDIPCEFSVLDYAAERGKGEIVNLSLAGFALKTNADISTGENLRVSVVLPDGFKCGFSGVLVREIGDKNYAFKIIQMEAQDRAILGDFILTQLEEENYIIKKFMKRSDAEN